MSASVWKGVRCPKRGVVVGEQARWVGWVTVNDSKNADANSTANPISRVGVGEQARWVGWVTVNKRGGEVGRTSRVMPLTKKPQAS